MICKSLEELQENPLFVRLEKAFPNHDLYVKLEGLNTAGSIKLKTAIALVDSLEKDGRLTAGGWLVESSSGSLGVALAGVCARRGYKLSIVTDPNANPASIVHMRALGADVEVVTERDEAGGFLGTRLARIRELQEAESGPQWLNQYSNSANPAVHRSKTYPAIVCEFGDPDFIFVGAGTTGTLMGVSQGVAERGASTRLYAIDSIGSVTFGGAPSARHVPGLGASVPPPLFDGSIVPEQHYVGEFDAVRECRRVASLEGFLPGGSTGTILAGFQALEDEIPHGSLVVVIAPDMGERYLDTIYNDEWVSEKFKSREIDFSAQPTSYAAKTTREELNV
ncbi:2,3-diaminopropionate biosynthesis protein SbnA [Paenarthrobacter sp. NPDC058040]|uniref:2,3-diaminopropionate biosynthesis protein SbnA n=1 Tax=unclassified Paenarthrobacter TaxID=2634190 RepID=UPI0036DD8704